MNISGPYGFWLSQLASEADHNPFLRALFGLLQELGQRHQIPCVTPTPSSQTKVADAGLAVNINGGADAFGTNTVSIANVGVLVVDRGLAQCASGSAVFVAAAERADEGAPFASAYAQLDIVGADISRVTESHASYSDATKAIDTASVHFAAMDLLFDWTAGGCKDDVFDCHDDHDKSPCPAVPDIDVLDGNLAEFAVTSSAFGENTFASVAADAIAVQDALSSVAVSAMAAVDASVSYTSTAGTTRADVITMSAELGFCHGFAGDDRITGGAGRDWIFGDQGSDRLSGAAGDDNLFGGAQSDQLTGGAGNDWMFGGSSSDTLDGGAGDDLLFGDEGADEIDGGAGSDIISGGSGADRMTGGAGDDWFQLGASRGDGNDRYSGGAGADHYLIQGEFDRDVISDFSIADGDRLFLLFEGGDAEAVSIGMQRGGKDLIITFAGGYDDQLTLTNFFGINSGIQDMPKAGALSAAQVATMLEIITASPEEAPDLHLAEQTLTIGDMLSSIG